jgi:glutathione S-transferase
VSVIEIFTKPGCGWAERNFAALIEKGVEFRTVMSCDAAGRKTAEFRSLSPYGKTPVLRFGHEVVWESAVMNEFIDDRFPTPALRPPDALGRAQARLLTHHCDFVLMPGLNALARTGGGPPAEVIEATTRDLAQLAAWWTARPSSGPLWRGERLSLVDIACHTYFQAVGVIEAMDMPIKPELGPELTAWRTAVAAHPSIEAAGEIGRSISFSSDAAEFDV